MRQLAKNSAWTTFKRCVLLPSYVDGRCMIFARLLVFTVCTGSLTSEFVLAIFSNETLSECSVYWNFSEGIWFTKNGWLVMALPFLVAASWAWFQMGRWAIPQIQRLGCSEIAQKTFVIFWLFQNFSVYLPKIYHSTVNLTMAVPKKRTSKAKRNARKANWKRKGYPAAQKSFSLSKSMLTGKTTSFIYTLEIDDE